MHGRPQRHKNEKVHRCYVAEATWPAQQAMLARVIVYWPAEGQRKAVDPHKIPYGSKVVVDRGDINRGRYWSGRNQPGRRAAVIDRYFESEKQALAWARSTPIRLEGR